MATSDRSERILALLLLSNLKDASQQEKVLQLSLAGFSNWEIADLLGTSTAVVATSRYSAKKTGARKKATTGRRRK